MSIEIPFKQTDGACGVACLRTSYPLGPPFRITWMGYHPPETFAGSTFTVQFDRRRTVGELKEYLKVWNGSKISILSSWQLWKRTVRELSCVCSRLQDACGVDPSLLRIVFSQRQLQDDDRLEDLGIFAETCACQVPPLHAGVPA